MVWGSRTSNVKPDRPAARHAVVCRRVTKDFRSGDSRVRALQGIDLEVPFGEMLLLVGQSGCGKTTLISIMAGLLDPTEGDVELLGRSREQLRGRRLVQFRGQHVGFVFQQYNLLPALTADFPTPAQRPLFSALDCQRFMDTFNLRLPDWQEALTLAMAEIQSTP